MRRRSGPFFLIFTLACGAAPGPDDSRMCRVVDREVALPRELRETSGLALGPGGMLWTHNDGADALLYAVDAAGALRARVRISGAVLSDWEDIEAGACSEGRCLYLADIGDNAARRESIAVWRVAEPAAADGATAAATPLRMRYPAGPRDAESLFLGPDGTPHIVTKGRSGPVELYRAPASVQSGATHVLELVAELAPRARRHDDLVTGAAASPDGQWIAIRSYAELRLHRTAELLAGRVTPAFRMDLRPLREVQGEGVAITNELSVWLSSEAEGGGVPVLTRLDCGDVTGA